MNQPLLRLALRISDENADHHLWDNHGTWWCHFTVHAATGEKYRVRRSLRTSCLSSARRRRDRLLSALQDDAR